MIVVTINIGSSSVRLGCHEVKTGSSSIPIEVEYRKDEGDPEHLLRRFCSTLHKQPEVVGHRVVHGGDLTRAAFIDEAVLEAIHSASELAPLHNPSSLAWIFAAKKYFGPNIPQAAIFDTALFATLPQLASTYALPLDLQRAHRIRRYGFHGIAHEAMLNRCMALFPSARPRRLITLQLGSGCSVSAFLDGRVVDTSMGFTPLEGLLMATRCGDIDPGVLLYLLRRGVLQLEELEHVLAESSGLAGLSGGMSDMRGLLLREDADARLAVDLFCYRVRKYVGAYAAALGGLDMVAFSGGIGVHSPEIRRRCLSELSFLGIALCADRNDAGQGQEHEISIQSSPVKVFALPVREGSLIAEHAAGLLRG